MKTRLLEQENCSLWSLKTLKGAEYRDFLIIFISANNWTRQIVLLIKCDTVLIARAKRRMWKALRMLDSKRERLPRIQTCYAGSKDGVVIIWEVDPQAHRVRRARDLDAHPFSGITCFEWSPDSTLLAICGPSDSSDVLVFNVNVRRNYATLRQFSMQACFFQAAQ